LTSTLLRFFSLFSVICQLLIFVTNTYDNQLKMKKALFWLTVSEVSVKVYLAPCFWACGEAGHAEGMTWEIWSREAGREK
jgi:hypothetical protein